MRAAAARSWAFTNPSRKRIAEARRIWTAACSSGVDSASAESILEERDGPIDPLELGKNDQHFDPQRSPLRVGEKLLRNCPRPRPLPCGLVRARRGERSTLPRTRGRPQASTEGLLGKLCPDGRGAAHRGRARGLVELRRDLSASGVPRERRGGGRGEVGRRRTGDARMNGRSSLTEVVVKRRREKWMREANRPAVDARRRARRPRARAPPPQRRRENVVFGSRPEGRRERERCARSRRKARQPRPNEVVERVRHRKRLQRVNVAVERAGELERKERVPTRALVDAEERLTWKGPTEPIEEQPMNRPNAQCPDGDSPNSSAGSPSSDELASVPRRRERRTRTSPRASGAQKPAPLTTTRPATGRRRPRSDRDSAPRPSSAPRTATARARASQDRPRALRAEARPRVRVGEAVRGTAARRRARRRRDRRAPSGRGLLGLCRPGRENAGTRAATCSTPKSHSVDFPMPGSPSRTSASGRLRPARRTCEQRRAHCPCRRSRGSSS